MRGWFGWWRAPLALIKNEKAAYNIKRQNRKVRKPKIKTY